MITSSQGTHNTSRTVRVFISSNFRDMQTERDYLIQTCFPHLCARCKARLIFIEEENAFYLTYSIYRDRVASLALVRSTDPNLRSCEKLGLMFSMDQWQAAFPRDAYTRYPFRLVPVRGHLSEKNQRNVYWMYFGDSHIWPPVPMTCDRVGHSEGMEPILCHGEEQYRPGGDRCERW